MTTDNDTIRQLLELMKALKCDQSTASAIQGLTARVANLEAIASRTGSTNRTHGYVNWNNTHDILKTKQWKKLSEFTNFCGSLERDAIPKFYVCVKMNIKNIVNEETRFPQVLLHTMLAIKFTGLLACEFYLFIILIE